MHCQTVMMSWRWVRIDSREYSPPSIANSHSGGQAIFKSIREFECPLMSSYIPPMNAILIQMNPGHIFRLSFFLTQFNIEICALLGYYTAYSGISFPTFRDICPETSVRNYRFTLHNIPEERRSQLLRNGSLKSFQHCFPSTTWSLKMCLHREGCCSGNTVLFLSLDMLFKPMKIFKEVLLSLAEYFGTFAKFFALLSSHRRISCDHSVFFECRPELRPSSAHILWFISVPPNTCVIAPHYVMMASFQMLSSSSYISFCNIQWYIIWEPLNDKW